MNQVTQPSKEQIREWLKSRHAKGESLPDIDQIRRELGWKLVEKGRKAY